MRSIHLNLSTATKRDKFIGIAFFGLTIYFLVRSFILSWSIDIWYDELFSMEFSSCSVKELVAYTARDVHPPLYYMIVRFVTLLFKGLGLTNFGGGGIVPVETVAKIVSIIPFILLIIYAITNIRKNFGWLTAGLFSFAVVTMPGLPEYTTEIRMYSWAIFFVTATLLHGFNLVRSMARGIASAEEDGKAGNGGRLWDVVNGAAMFFYAVCASYTHYYAAVAIGAIYFMIFVWMLKAFVMNMKARRKASKEDSKPDDTSSAKRGVYNFRPLAVVVITANLVIAAYIPWASALLSQVNAVSNNYWIQPVGLHTLGSCAKYMFSGYFVNPKIAAASAVILVLLIAIIFMTVVLELIKVKKEPAAYSYVAFWVLPMLVFVGLLASVIIRPVFVNRYMVPAFGAFWLAVSIAIGNIFASISFKGVKEKITAITALLLALAMLVVGIVDFRAFIGNEKYRIVNMVKTAELFEGLDEDTIIISNFDHVQALLSYYLNENGIAGAYKGDTPAPYSIYLYKAEAEPLIKENVPGLYSIEDSADIYNYLEAGKKVLFLGSFNSREVLLEEWKNDYGITYENKGSYLMERYWFDVFELAIQ